MKEPVIKPGEIAGAFSFLAILAFFLWLVSAISGCGDPGEPGARELAVAIHCDQPVEANRCFVLVHGATDVRAFYGDLLAWWDLDIPNPEDRQSYLDSPRRGVFTVEACNPGGCLVASEDLP